MEVSPRSLGPALALGAALFLAACGGGSDDTDKTAGAGPDAGAPPVNVAPGHERVARLDLIVKVGVPTSVATPPDDPGTLFITTQPGRVYVVEDGKLRDEPFLQIQNIVNSEGSEQGMFAIAFPPDYSESGKFYVSHNNHDNSVQVDEFQRSAADPLVADRDSRRKVLNVAHGKGARNQHNGGELEFGPDGHLYIGLGDGGPVGKEFVSNRGQRRSTRLGKILRIDPEHPADGKPYTVPADNPFVHLRGKRIRPEIYSYGLRNPYRFSFDSQTGALAIGDVGAADVEEIDYVEKGEGKGANFGWPLYEGDRPYRRDYKLSPGPGDGPLVKPVHTYRHKNGACSVIGGYVMHDERIPQLDGSYIYGDACTGELRVATLTPKGAKDDRALGLELGPETLFGIVSFGEGSDGRIYAASFGGGVYALNPESEAEDRD